MLSISVAVANNNVIGAAGSSKLLWHLPADLKRFRELTDSKVIIMGYNTFVSLGRMLPNRKHVVLCGEDVELEENENLKVVRSIDDLQTYVDDDNENFVIGGGSVYAQLISKTSKLYITRIYYNFDGEVKFPEYSGDEWRLVEEQIGVKDDKNIYDYEFLVYHRR